MKRMQHHKLEKLPFKAARRDALDNLNFWGFESELHINPVPFYLDSPWCSTLMPLERVRRTVDGTEY